jgi:outer membrane immunogenic protein
MKKLLLTTAFLAAAIGAAEAADLPVKAAPAPTPEVYNFTGFYAGGGLGYVWENYDGSFVNPPPGSWNVTQAVALAYAKAGAQYQFAGTPLVLGVEGQFAWLLGDNSGSDCNPPALCAAGGNMSGQFANNIWSFGGRGGIVWGRWMPFVSGGYASTRVDNFLNLPSGAFESARTTHNGGYVGAGWDWMAMPHVLFTIEYRHYEFNSQTVTPTNGLTGAPVPGDTWTIKPKADTVTVGLAWLFDWGGPVVARY